MWDHHHVCIHIMCYWNCRFFNFLRWGHSCRFDTSSFIKLFSCFGSCALLAIKYSALSVSDKGNLNQEKCFGRIKFIMCYFYFLCIKSSTDCRLIIAIARDKAVVFSCVYILLQQVSSHIVNKNYNATIMNWSLFDVQELAAATDFIERHQCLSKKPMNQRLVLFSLKRFIGRYQ